jgi:hypothetical protein
VPWNGAMPVDFTDGQIVDEGDLDPIVQNILFLRYATVFQSGVRRITGVGSITTSEIIVMVTPSVAQENGYLYKIEGALIWGSTVLNDRIEILLHDGSTTGSPTLLSFSSALASAPNSGFQETFSIYVKSVANANKTYGVGMRRLAGSGNVNVGVNSWTAVLRSGDNALLNEV